MKNAQSRLFFVFILLFTTTTVWAEAGKKSQGQPDRDVPEVCQPDLSSDPYEYVPEGGPSYANTDEQSRVRIQPGPDEVQERNPDELDARDPGGF